MSTPSIRTKRRHMYSHRPSVNGVDFTSFIEPPKPPKYRAFGIALIVLGLILYAIFALTQTPYIPFL